MPRDIDIVIERVRALHPDAKIEQLRVSHPGVDDDGLWFFGLPGERKDIQVESSTGAAPFVIEHDDMKTSAEAISGASVDQAVREVSVYLEILKQRANQSPLRTPSSGTPAAIDLSQRNGCVFSLWNRYPFNTEFSIMHPSRHHPAPQVSDVRAKQTT